MNAHHRRSVAAVVLLAACLAGAWWFTRADRRAAPASTSDHRPSVRVESMADAVVEPPRVRPDTHAWRADRRASSASARTVGARAESRRGPAPQAPVDQAHPELEDLPADTSLHELPQAEILARLKAALANAPRMPPDHAWTHADLVRRFGFDEEVFVRTGRARSLSPAEMVSMPTGRLARAVWRSLHPRPDNPGPAMQFRNQQWVDERGQIPPNALVRAARAYRERQRQQEREGRAWPPRRIRAPIRPEVAPPADENPQEIRRRRAAAEARQRAADRGTFPGPEEEAPSPPAAPAPASVPEPPAASPGEAPPPGGAGGTAPATTGGIGRDAWEELGPGNIGGRVRALVFHPSTMGVAWVGSVSGGIWKTFDSGATWIPCDDFMANLAVSTLVLDPTNPNILYAGTGEGFYNADGIRGAGVFRSTDGGASWTQLGATSTSDWYYVNRLAIAPGGETILAATRSGIWLSRDAGTSWSQRSAVEMLDVSFNPGDGRRALASTWRGAAYYSTDGGWTWSQATGLPYDASNFYRRVEVAYAPSDTAVVYASVSVNSGELWRSSDGGQSYTLRNTGTNYLGSQGWYDNCVWVDPTNKDTVIVGGIDLWRSTDSGATLTRMSEWWNAPSSAHADQHRIVHHPNFNGTTNRIAWFGNDGGIYRANNVYTAAGTSGWQELNNGLRITQFYGGSANAAGVVYGGTQDNGTLRFHGDSEAWIESFGGDGGFSASDQADNRYHYGEYVYLQLHRSSDSGVTASYIHTGIADAGSSANFIAPFLLDPNNQGRMLGGGVSLWRSENVRTGSPPTWTAIKGDVGSYISAIAVDSGSSDTIWVGHNNGNVYRTANGTAGSPTWTQVDGVSLPNRYVTRIAIDPVEPRRVYVAFSGFNSDNLWRTEDNGATWTNVNAAAVTPLPSAPIRGIAIWERNPDSIYVGTEVGIYASTDSGRNWSVSNDGPANVSVDELFWLGDTLHAVTHGRGIFRLNVASPPGYAGGPTKSADGLLSDWTSGERMEEEAIDTAWIGFDDTYVYIAIEDRNWNGLDGGSGDGFLYIDTNPGSGLGASISVDWNGTHAFGPGFRPEMAFCIEDAGYTNGRRWNGSSWVADAWTPYAAYIGNAARPVTEIIIPKARLGMGRSDSIALAFWSQWEDQQNIFASWPKENASSGANRTELVENGYWFSSTESGAVRPHSRVINRFVVVAPDTVDRNVAFNARVVALNDVDETITSYASTQYRWTTSAGSVSAPTDTFVAGENIDSVALDAGGAVTLYFTDTGSGKWASKQVTMPAAIVVDGALADWPASSIVVSEAGDTFYFAVDDSSIYIGWADRNWNSADGGWGDGFIYLDTLPFSGTGATRSIDWDGRHDFGPSFRPRAVFAIEGDGGYTNGRAWNGTDWTADVFTADESYIGWSGNPNTEIRIAKSRIGLGSDSLLVMAFIKQDNTQAVFGSFPLQNPSRDVAATETFHSAFFIPRADSTASPNRSVMTALELTLPAGVGPGESFPFRARALNALGDTVIGHNAPSWSIAVSSGSLTHDAAKDRFVMGVLADTVAVHGVGTVGVTLTDTESGITVTETFVVGDTSGPNTWYLNDTSTAGDSFTGAVGSDANLGFLSWSPFRTFQALENRLSPGDTVLVDAGWYYENDTVTIDETGIVIAGVDSASTVIVFDQAAAAAARCILAFRARGLHVRDLGVRRGRYGFLVLGTDSALIQRVRVDSCGTEGLKADSGSHGLRIEDADFVGNGSDGLRIYASDSVHVRRVRSIGNSLWGMSFENMDSSIVEHTEIRSNAFDGLIGGPGVNVAVRACTVARNGSYGLFLYDLANLEVSSCSAAVNDLTGITVFQCTSVVVVGNAVEGNSWYGLDLTVSRGLVADNAVVGGASDGVSISPGETIVFVRNLIRGNTGDGLSVFSGYGSIYAQNTIESNAGWAIGLYADYGSDTFTKNNILTSRYAAWADSGVRNWSPASVPIAFHRNWWGTRDSAAIRRLIHGRTPESTALVRYLPYRLGPVDTVASGETVAPRAPDTVAARALSRTSTRVSWSAPTSPEEADPTFDLAGFRVYRSPTADTSYWALVSTLGPGARSYDDSGAIRHDSYHYRITAFDGAESRNESFYSDSIVRATIALTGTATLQARPGLGGCTITIFDGVETYTTVTDTAGAFTLTNISPGTYTLRFEGTGHRSATRLLVIVEADSALGVQPPLAAGDVNRDGRINIQDAAAMEAVIRMGVFWPPGDIDGDGDSDRTDSSWVRSGFGRPPD